MIEDKPACPTHGVRFMARGRGGGMTSKFGQWFVCGLCDFKRWVQEDGENLVLASTAVTCYLFALALAFLR
jgi:hypothetical protein